MYIKMGELQGLGRNPLQAIVRYYLSGELKAKHPRIHSYCSHIRLNVIKYFKHEVPDFVNSSNFRLTQQHE
jgi:hypothetical protein